MTIFIVNRCLVEQLCIISAVVGELRICFIFLKL
ncbi:hypothetical protein EMIT0111MI5_140134 [Burkholderia sp. IT-111MI5]